MFDLTPKSSRAFLNYASAKYHGEPIAMHLAYRRCARQWVREGRGYTWRDAANYRARTLLVAFLLRL